MEPEVLSIEFYLAAGVEWAGSDGGLMVSNVGPMALPDGLGADLGVVVGTNPGCCGVFGSGSGCLASYPGGYGTYLGGPGGKGWYSPRGSGIAFPSTEKGSSFEYSEFFTSF